MAVRWFGLPYQARNIWSIRIHLVKMQRKDIELMAPAGSFATLHAAIQGKADAIYFGVGKLNMRSGSSMNFTQDNLGEIIDICNDKGLKSYMTLNTVVYDNDFDLMEESLNLAKDKKVTAVIASDIAVLSKAREIGLNVHASTQLNISNIRAVEFYSKFTDVMVLARELKLTQVKEIYKQIQERNICGPSGQTSTIGGVCSWCTMHGGFR